MRPGSSADKVAVDAEPLGGTGSVVLDKNIRGLYKLIENATTGFCLKVDGHAALVAIQIEEPEAVSAFQLETHRARVWSPLSGGSILITSAPMSPSSIEQNGPAITWLTSKTRTPARGNERPNPPADRAVPDDDAWARLLHF